MKMLTEEEHAALIAELALVKEQKAATYRDFMKRIAELTAERDDAERRAVAAADAQQAAIDAAVTAACAAVEAEREQLRRERDAAIEEIERLALKLGQMHAICGSYASADDLAAANADRDTAEAAMRAAHEARDRLAVENVALREALEKAWTDALGKVKPALLKEWETALATPSSIERVAAIRAEARETALVEARNAVDDEWRKRLGATQDGAPPLNDEVVAEHDARVRAAALAEPVIKEALEDALAAEHNAHGTTGRSAVIASVLQRVVAALAKETA